MRVLIATDHFPPFIGGAHRWASLLATGLARRGHDVAVATVWHGGLPRTEYHGECRVPVWRLRQLRTAVPSLIRDRRQRHAPPFPDPVTVRDLRRVIDRTQPEVVLAHGWLAFSVAAALSTTKIPLVVSAHDYGYFCATRVLLYGPGPCTGPAPLKCLRCSAGFYGRSKGWTAAITVALCKRLVASRMAALQSVTSFVDDVNARHLLGSRGTHESFRRFTMPAFVEVDGRDKVDHAAVEAVLSGLPREPFILFVGALRAIKGIDVLFDAYSRLTDPPPLVLIGTVDGDTPSRFPPDARVLTDVSHPVVMAAMSRAMFGVVPSVWPEPGATVVMEGLTQGIPMIGTMPSGTVDFLGAGAGLLVASGNATALADAMRSLIDDIQLREELGRAGRARSRAFQAEAVLPRYEEMLAWARSQR